MDTSNIHAWLTKKQNLFLRYMEAPMSSWDNRLRPVTLRNWVLDFCPEKRPHFLTYCFLHVFSKTYVRIVLRKTV